MRALSRAADAGVDLVNGDARMTANGNAGAKSEDVGERPVWAASNAPLPRHKLERRNVAVWLRAQRDHSWRTVERLLGCSTLTGPIIPSEERWTALD